MTAKQFVRAMIKGWKEEKQGFTVFSLHDTREHFMSMRENGDPERSRIPLRSVRDHNYCALGIVLRGKDGTVKLTTDTPHLYNLPIIRIVELSNSCSTKTEAIRKIRAFLGV